MLELFSRGRRILSDGVAGVAVEETEESGTVAITGDPTPRLAGRRVAFFFGLLSFFSSGLSAFSARLLLSVFGNSSSLSFLFRPRFSFAWPTVVSLRLTKVPPD